MPRWADREGSDAHRPTMGDVAATVGVTQMTVSRAFARPDLVDPATRERILRAADKLGYVPNRAAGALASAVSPLLGVLIPSLADATYHGIFSALAETVGEDRYLVVAAETQYSEDRERAALLRLLGWRPAGLVLAGSLLSGPTPAALRRMQTPVCQVMGLLRSGRHASVGFSNRAAMKALGQHLLSRGRRRFALVQPARTEHARLTERFEAFEEVVRAAGAESAILTLDRPAPLSLADGGLAVELALRAEPRFDTLVFMNDVPATGAILHCQRHGIAVPARLGITGFGGLDIAKNLRPALATVRVPLAEMGRRAGALLLAAGGRRWQRAEHVDLGFEVVTGGST
jgi:LacI family gluconate utilization system Gnt-I transcriptional repressor